MKNLIFALTLLAVTATLSLNSTASNVYSTYKEAWRNCVGGKVSPRYDRSELAGYVCVGNVETLTE